MGWVIFHVSEMKALGRRGRAGHAHQPSLHQLPDELPARDPAHLFEVGPRDGLPVRDHRERFERGVGELQLVPGAPEPGEPRVVVTYPVSVGKMDWATPLGLTKIQTKHPLENSCIEQ